MSDQLPSTSHIHSEDNPTEPQSAPPKPDYRKLFKRAAREVASLTPESKSEPQQKEASLPQPKPISPDLISPGFVCRAASSLRPYPSSHSSSSLIPPPSSLKKRGPKTAWGKRRSRVNAIKHGLRASDGLFMASLSRYERKIFSEMRNTLHADYNPITSQEQFLVDRITIQYLRLFRLYRLEHTATKKSLDDPLAKDSVLPHLDRLSRYDWRIERQLRILHNRLHDHCSKRGNFGVTFYSPKD